ncbi:hypothetical protein GCM10009616_14980 [Microlunatus lacustris]
MRRLRSPEPDLAVILPDPLAGQVRDLLTADQRVEAVRLTRRRTGVDLLTAVRAVNAMASPPSSSPSS